MTQIVYVGIDVSLESLSVASLDQQRQPVSLGEFANTASGLRHLLKRLQRLGRVHVCLEPTSCYHQPLAFLLDAADGVIVSLVNPRAVRNYARSLMLRGKTDPGDAVVLALYGAANRPEPWQAPAAEALELRAVSRRIADLTDRRTALKNSRHAARKAAASSLVINDLNLELRQLARRLDRLGREARELIRRLPRFERRYQLLVSVKGIGQVSAIRILSELGVVPDGLGKKQWLALAGLDPVPDDSGKHSGQRRISRQGNARLRRALMMPALTAIRYCPQVKAYYENLLQRCRCAKMQAVCAVMRKLLQAIWGMLNTDTPFNPAKFFAG